MNGARASVPATASALARDAGAPSRTRQLANFAVFEAAWFACILGVAHGQPGWGTGAVAGAVAWHVAISARPATELALVAILCAIGLVAESLVVAQGHVAYDAGQPVRWLAPYWLVALWGEFGIALNVTLRWLKRKPLLALVLGAVFGPLSFLGGVRLGGARFVDEPAALVTLACMWAVLMPLAMWISDRFDGVTAPLPMPEFSTLLPIALSGLALIAALGFGTWIASVVRHDASLVDRMWSLMIAGPALVYAAQTSWTSPRAIAVQVLVLAWGLRLSAYITWRNWGHGEDRRYQAIRQRNQPHFALKSLVLVFALQMVLAWIVSAPTLAALSGGRVFGMLDAAGIAIALVGFLFETIGDAQMAAFKREAANRGRVMDRGLWRYTRHPNYFGEACFWWGLWLIALAAGGVAATWTVLSPLLMTVLLLKVSGVAMLERDIGERRPAYRDYVARTNAFIPGPPRRKGPSA